jgi:hypothetical protein
MVCYDEVTIAEFNLKDADENLDAHILCQATENTDGVTNASRTSSGPWEVLTKVKARGPHQAQHFGCLTTPELQPCR